MRRAGRLGLLLGAALLAAVVAAVLVARGGGDAEPSPPAAPAPSRAAPAGPRPGGFYVPPDPLPRAAAGTLLRTAPLPGVPAGARGWRILYLSRGADGRPAALSGMLLVPATPAPRGGRPVVVWAHPTVGVAQRCAPSIGGAHFGDHLDGTPAFLAAGDAVVVPDYPGLGTPGAHPYLMGEDEAIAIADAVRAVRDFPPADAGARFAVFGHSQGGGAALATAALAGTPWLRGLTLVGAVAAAPVTRLEPLFADALRAHEGRVLAAYAIAAWARVDRDPSLLSILSPRADAAVRRIAATCIHDPLDPAADVPRSLGLQVRFRSRAPWDAPAWRELLERNSLAGARTPVPMLVTQGTADRLIDPAITTAFARRLCRNGNRVAYRLLPGVDHTRAGRVTAPRAVSWIAARFAGRPAPVTCAPGRPGDASPAPRRSAGGRA